MTRRNGDHAGGNEAMGSDAEKAAALARKLAASQNLKASETSECSYLPGRVATNVAFVAPALEPGVYQALMDLNFRRAGLVFYRPQCPECQECRMLRVPVARFRPSRSQRRCARRNRDMRVAVSAPCPSIEKHRLFQRYLDSRHDGPMTGAIEEYVEFLCMTAVQSLEIEYRLGGRLLGVGVVDREPEALSAVYFYYDPEASSRSLGVFNILTCLDLCRGFEIAHLYLGYYVRGARKMEYKACYRPHEILNTDFLWKKGVAYLV
ncbi:MAG: arginyltransferase [Vicinamibacteria bacterium]|nr:arginyltransferase [Vicinamibacteria bacterium]